MKMTFEDAFDMVLGSHAFELEESDEDRFREAWDGNPHLHDMKGVWRLGALTSPTRRDEPAKPPEHGPQTGSRRKNTGPGDADPEAKALHAKVEARVIAEKVDYYIALADVTGYEEFRRSAAPPLGSFSAEADATDRQVHDLAWREGLDGMTGYGEAAHLLELHRTLADVVQDDGKSDVEWLDTATPRLAKPWDAEEWEIAQRRANAAGVAVDEVYWRAAAEKGQDMVYELAQEAREERLRAAQADVNNVATMYHQASDERRAKTLRDVVDRQAEDRLDQRGLRR